MNPSRILLAMLGAGMLGTMALAFQGAGQAGKTPDAPKPEVIKERLILEERMLREQFQDFLTSILKLKQRLERSDKREDLDRAKALEKVLEKIRESSITSQFEKMVEFLNKTNFNNLGDVKQALEDSKKLATDLRYLIDLFTQGNSASKLTEARIELQKLIAAIDRAITSQQITQALTDLDKTNREELKGLQGNNIKEVADIGDKMKKFGQGTEAKDNKGNSKEGKGTGQGEAKDAGKGSDSKGNAKEGQGAENNKPSEAKGGDKGGQGKDGQPSEAKGGKGSEGSKEGGAKGSKGGEGSQGEKKGNEGDDKGKEGGAKDAGDKSGVKEKTAEAKGSEGDKQASEAKGSKGGEGSKEAGAKGSKSSEGSPSASKSGGKPSESKGGAKSGSKSQGQSSSKDGGQPGGDPSAQKDQPQKDNQPQDITDGRKKVQDAEYAQRQAEEKITKQKPKEASEDQGTAIKRLEEAKKKLEDLLRQMREEELERLLAALEARCHKMLQMQIEVLGGTESVHKGVEKAADKTPDRNHKIESLKLSDKEKEIVLEASKAIEMLEAEGSAVAFPEVFQQVREDMKAVQRRLEITDVGVVTQAIEKDIIDTLKEMIDALKKAQQELKDKKNPPPGQPPPPNPNADQKLLDKIAELKMIRSLQIRVNSRTTTYGRMYQGEQAREGHIRQEIIQLGSRQERIFDITNRIAKGDNK